MAGSNVGHFCFYSKTQILYLIQTTHRIEPFFKKSPHIFSIYHRGKTAKIRRIKGKYVVDL